MAVVLRIALGIVLVLHGLANAVLTLRGVESVAPGEWSLPLTVACVIAIVGFVAAGFGLLGVRPLSPIVLWAPIISGCASIGAHVVLGDGDLWLGVVLSLVLPILTAVLVTKTVYRHAPATHSLWRGIGHALGGVLVVWISTAAVLWPWHRTWGTTPQEWAMALPGDREHRAPALEILHGVTIDAPPSAVWPWLVQIGQDRAGFYSYDRLERLFGADVHNVRELRSDWQTRQVGDLVPATQAGYLGGIFGDRPGWTVAAVEPERALVLRNWGAFVLLPHADGQTRFLIRSTISDERIPAWAAAINMAAFELPHFIMQRRMMLTIKDLAEVQ